MWHEPEKACNEYTLNPKTLKLLEPKGLQNKVALAVQGSQMNAGMSLLTQRQRQRDRDTGTERDRDTGTQRHRET